MPFNCNYIAFWDELTFPNIKSVETMIEKLKTLDFKVRWAATIRADLFKKEHLKALLNSFSIFPLSSYVRLNSNSIGKVVETYPDQPLRPKIKIEFDSQNQKVLTDRVVDLSENTLLHIIDSVSEEEFQSIPIK